MDYHIFHWIWYLLGIIFAPRLTIAIILSIYGQNLHLPLIIMLVIWYFGILSLFETKGENNG
jgi:hypothetical protein